MVPSIRHRITDNILNEFPCYLLQACTRFGPKHRIPLENVHALIKHELRRCYKSDERHLKYIQNLKINVDFLPKFVRELISRIEPRQAVQSDIDTMVPLNTKEYKGLGQGSNISTYCSF